MEYHFTITNLKCTACNTMCTMLLKKIDGVVAVTIDARGLTKVSSTKPLDMDQMKQLLKEKGYLAMATH